VSGWLARRRGCGFAQNGISARLPGAQPAELRANGLSDPSDRYPILLVSVLPESVIWLS
jgi:hypothetical protein